MKRKQSWGEEKEKWQIKGNWATVINTLEIEVIIFPVELKCWGGSAERAPHKTSGLSESWLTGNVKWGEESWLGFNAGLSDAVGKAALNIHSRKNKDNKRQDDGTDIEQAGWARDWDHNGALLNYLNERRGEKEECRRKQRNGKQQPYRCWGCISDRKVLLHISPSETTKLTSHRGGVWSFENS